MTVGKEDGIVGVMEHPEPPVRFADPEAGLAGGDRRTGCLNRYLQPAGACVTPNSKTTRDGTNSPGC